VLLARVEQTIAHHALMEPGETVVVGVSGGADSLVLLHILHHLGRWRLHVATLDHGMRGAAGAADADFVRATAAAWGLPATVGRADVPALMRAGALNAEEGARRVRYVFLRRIAQHVGAARIAVGHHQDDQGETVLMHLIRGSGLDGLRGMLPAAPLEAFDQDVPLTCDPPLMGAAAAPKVWPLVVRPLLDVSRAEIDAYAAEHDLRPRHDATNDDPTYLRNRLRHEIIPLLTELNPNIGAALARTADILREDAALVHRVGESALRRLERGDQADAVSLDRAAWARLSAAEQRYVVRAAAARLRPGQRDIGFEHVENALTVAGSGKIGAVAMLPGGLVLRVDYETLVMSAADALPAVDAPALAGGSERREFSPGERIVWVCGEWVFEARPLDAGEEVSVLHADPLAAALVVPERAQLALRTRQPGDRFAPRGLGGRSQKLSDTLVNMRVPFAWRDRVPLLVIDGRVAWFVAPTAGGVRGRVAESFSLAEETIRAGQIVMVVGWRKA
jgi:tRNA(Ile)-lysidine synthetase-like protein